MKKHSQIRQQGLVTLIFILVMALIATLILIIGQSRLLLALQRGKSSGDIIITTYQAEYEINDLLARLQRGTLRTSDFSSFPINKTIAPGFTLVVDGEIEGDNQILTVTSKKAFATSKIQAIRAVNEAASISEIELVLMLDCTGSMNSRSAPGSPTTRMFEQKQAAKRFVQQLKDHPNGDFVNLGISVFSTNANWMQSNSGSQITPSSNTSYDEILQSLESKFASTRDGSSACNVVNGWTNHGGVLTFAQNYFASSPNVDMKKVEVLISDGEPTARTVDTQCPPSRFCENCEEDGKRYLACAITRTDEKWNGTNFGRRDPGVTAFAIIVLDPPRADVRQIFERAIGADNYFTSRNATDISAKLDIIFNRIVTSLSKTTISRVIPLIDD